MTFQAYWRENMYKIIFIAHGGSNIGMGHIIRSMSLAEAFRTNNHTVKFISKYEVGKRTLIENKYELISLEGKELNTQGFVYGSKEELQRDLTLIKEILIIEKPDIIVVDSYNVTVDFFNEIANYAKYVIYIDDICAFDYPVDMIINGNISGPLLNYKKVIQNKKFLLGLDYNLIRQEFSEMPKREVAYKCNSIMISTGAADPHNMTKKILNTILNNSQLQEFKISVVIGKAFNSKNVEEIKLMARDNSSIVLYENPSKISEIMLKSDLAITAGGSTIYELFACGVVTFAFIYADNQKDLVEVSETNGYLINLGYYNEIDANNIIEKIIKVDEDYELRKNIVDKIQDVLDCKGTKRIVNEVEKVMMEIYNVL